MYKIDTRNMYGAGPYNRGTLSKNRYAHQCIKQIHTLMYKIDTHIMYGKGADNLSRKPVNSSQTIHALCIHDMLTQVYTPYACKGTGTCMLEGKPKGEQPKP